MYPTLKARLARTRGGEAAGEAVDPLSLVPALQAQVAGLESDLPVFDVRLADEYVSEATAVSRFALFTLAAFASVAVLLAAAGVYAVMAHAVAGRRFEIGVRLALGASPRSILALVLAQGMRLTGAGIVAGLVGGLAIGRVLSGLLFGVGPRDPLTFASAALLLAATALAACWAPARRASRVEPREALRA
jgi:putative ABC transport system permease protein